MNDLKEDNLGKIQQVEIVKEVEKSYLDYAMSVIVSRALPDIRDGLKPVHRRILYAMHLMGLHYNANFTKSAKVVGEVLGKYHPHGDMPVYEALVRLAQTFSMRYPLIKGQGNFGSIDGDPPAAMRYTEVKLSKIADYMLLDIEKDTVDFRDNFDATLKEPLFLPALLPNILLMGSEGIAVGMATKIPPHNLKEVIEGIIETINKGQVVFLKDKKEQEKNVDFTIKKINLIASGQEKEQEKDIYDYKNISFESSITIDELIEKIPGPDFPTGGEIYSDQLKEIYASGRGKITVRGVAKIKETKNGRYQIIITEIPYQVNKAELVQKIAELIKEKRIRGITVLRDESDKEGLRIVIDLKKDVRPNAILNNIFKFTKLQTTFPANFVVLVDGTPYTLNLKSILVEYIKHRQKVIYRRTIFELTEAKKRAHILEGLKIALDNLDDVINTIKKSKTQEEAKKNLMQKFFLSEIQANAILDMQLRRLAALEREKIQKEYEEIKKRIDRLTDILKNPEKILEIIKQELNDLKEKFADERKTRIVKKRAKEFTEEDLVQKKDTLITITKTGYIKRVAPETYRAQKRGGKGVMGMTTKKEDEIEHLIKATTHDLVLFFTDKGKVYGKKAWEIPETTRQAKGQAIVNFIDIGQDEKIKSAIAFDKESSHLIIATKKGIVKKTPLSEFVNLRSSGLIAIKLRADDEVVDVKETKGEDKILLITRKGKGILFSEKDVRPMGRATTGVTGIKLEDGDYVIDMEVVDPSLLAENKKRKKTIDILTVSEKGIGKRTKIDLFPLQKRAGKGVKAAIVNEKTGMLSCALVIHKNTYQIVMTSKFGQVIKTPVKNIPCLGRSTQGVILMRFTNPNDKIAAVAAIEKEN